MGVHRRSGEIISTGSTIVNLGQTNTERFHLTPFSVESTLLPPPETSCYNRARGCLSSRPASPALRVASQPVAADGPRHAALAAGDSAGRVPCGFCRDDFLCLPLSPFFAPDRRTDERRGLQPRLDGVLSADPRQRRAAVDPGTGPVAPAHGALQR